MLTLLLRLILCVAAPTVLWSAPHSALADSFDDDFDDDNDDDGDFEDDEEETEQPPVTAGGNYTKKTYPIEELKRPLTLTKDMFEGKVGLRIDMSKGQAFEGWRGQLEARYGLQDHIELQAVVDASFSDVPEGAEPAEFFSVGIESAIIYDLVDFRLTADMVSRPDFLLDIVAGFPFRYRPKPQVAIIALNKLLTIHTAGGKPDLTLGVGLIYQAIPQVAIVAQGEVVVPEFDSDFVSIPASVAVQLSANNLLDLGLEFELADLKSENRFDNRFISLYAQFRI